MYLRPHNKFQEIDHCFLVGGGTHPGSGLPTIVQSAMISADLVERQYSRTSRRKTRSEKLAEEAER